MPLCPVSSQDTLDTEDLAVDPLHLWILVVPVPPDISSVVICGRRGAHPKGCLVTAAYMLLHQPF